MKTEYTIHKMLLGYQVRKNGQIWGDFSFCKLKEVKTMLTALGVSFRKVND